MWCDVHTQDPSRPISRMYSDDIWVGYCHQDTRILAVQFSRYQFFQTNYSKWCHPQQTSPFAHHAVLEMQITSIRPFKVG